MPKLLESADFLAHAIFADDMRVEVDGKVTYVGTYQGRMYVNGVFPVTLPKFAIHVSFSQRKDLFVPNLAIWIFLPGDDEEKPSVQGALTEASDGVVAREMAKDSVPDSHFVMLSAGLVLTPLIIKEPGSIAVRILRNDELHRCGRLTVLQGQLPPS